MSKSIIFFAAMVMSVCSTFAAPARMDTLEVKRAEVGLTLACTQDQLCVEIASLPNGCVGEACVDEGANERYLSFKLSGEQADPANMSYRLSDLSSADNEFSLQLWQKLIRFEGGFLLGVEAQESTSYSGGGASSTTLHLIVFLRGQSPFKVLSVPQSAHAMIRACFSERDMKQRAGACHDEYSFNASLVLAGSSLAGMPILHYRSKATSFPGHVSRSEDSLARRPLRQRDIVTVTDPRCSYQRFYHFSPKAHGYVTEMSPPDCSNYTVP